MSDCDADRVDGSPEAAASGRQTLSKVWSLAPWLQRSVQTREILRHDVHSDRNCSVPAPKSKYAANSEAPMTSTEGVEQAFQDLESAPPVLQGLLRPVLIRALQDPALMRHLGSAALSEHLAVLGQVLINLPSEGVGPPLPPLKTFIHLAVGQDVDDVEEAYRFAHTLDAPLRARVEGGLSRALQNTASRAGAGTTSLLALARLLALAFSNLPFVAHVLDGGEIESFLPQANAKLPSERPVNKGVKSARRKAGLAQQTAVSPQLAGFVGKFVEVIAVVSEPESAEHAGHMFVTIGRVLELSPHHVVLETLRGHHEGVHGGERLLLGMAHVVAMRTLTRDPRDQASKTG